MRDWGLHDMGEFFGIHDGELGDDGEFLGKEVLGDLLMYTASGARARIGIGCVPEPFEDVSCMDLCRASPGSERDPSRQQLRARQRTAFVRRHRKTHCLSQL